MSEANQKQKYIYREKSCQKTQILPRIFYFIIFFILYLISTYAGNYVRSRWYRLHTMRSRRCRLIKLVN